MPAISLDNEIKKYLPLLGVKDKRSILSQIKSLLAAKEVQHEKMSREVFIVQYNKDMDEAEAEVKAGLVISQEDLEKESAKWLISE